MNIKYSTKIYVCITTVSLGIFSFAHTSFGSDTSTLNQTISTGALSVDIVDASYNTVANPTTAFDVATVSPDCQGTLYGSFGTTSQKIYVQNLGAANDGWILSVAASSTTALWTSTSNPSDQFDFNDNSSGCDDGADADSLGGRMSFEASAGTLSTGTCASCTSTLVIQSGLSAFDEGSADSITLLLALAGSDDVGDWELVDVSLVQSIPGGTPAHDDYTIDMVLSVVAF